MHRPKRQQSLFSSPPEAPSPRRVLVIWLPDFRLERCGWAREEPAVLAAGRRGVLRVIAATPAAARRGIRPEMRVSEACALVPELGLEILHDDGPLPADGSAEERRDLRALARLLLPFTPAFGTLPPQGIAADITDTAALSGGERALMQGAVGRIRDAGHRCIAVTCASPRGGLALARSLKGDAVIPPGGMADALAPLPLARFDAPPALLARLAELGVQTAGDLAVLPRAAIAGRFGREGLVLRRLAAGEALGAPIGAGLAGDDGEHHALMPAPVARLEALLACCIPLVEALSEQLAAREQAATRLRLRLTLDDGHERLIFAQPAAPRRDADGLARLLRQKLYDLTLTAPVIEVGLAAVGRCPWQPTQSGLTGISRDAPAGLPALLARLTEHLGEDAIFRPRLEDRHRPEEGWAPERFLTGGLTAPASGDDVLRARARPAVLLPRPRRLLLEVDPEGAPRAVELEGRWRRVRDRIGPERLTGSWWEPDPLDRDYYRLALAARGRAGRSPWIYQDRRDGSWWLHGWFD